MKANFKQQYLFEESPVFNAVVSLALPSVMGQIILVIYNMADTYFVSLTGSDVMITSVTVCMPAFMFLSAISNLFGIGGASVISRFMGSRRRDLASYASSFAVWGCLGVSLLYCLGVSVFMDPFIDLLGGAFGPVHLYSRRYMVIAVVLGGTAASMNTLMSHLIRAEGRSFQASLGIMLGGVCNIGLDPLFMFVLLKPGNEVAAAALATALSNLIALAYFVLYIRKHREEMIFSARPSRAMTGSSIPSGILAAGIPACLMTLCENISYAVLDNLMSSYGTAAQAGVGVAKKINMLAHSVVRGMSQGVLPLIGYSYAAGKRTRMRRAFAISSCMSFGVSLICMTCCLLFSNDLAGLFIEPGSGSHGFAAVFLRILCLGAPFSAWAYSVISFFQAAGRMKKSLVLALMRKGILDIPMMVLLNEGFGYKGIVSATPAADIVCSAAAAVLFISFMKKHGADVPSRPVAKAADYESDPLP